MSTNGLYNYRAAVSDESASQRQERERFWKSLGKRIRNRSRIR